jgi:hypothetical protein
MNTDLPTRTIQITIKGITFFMALILLYSCESRINKLENEEAMKNISSLQSSIDSLNQNVYSLNDILLKLEASSTDQVLVKTPVAEEKSPDRAPEKSGKVACTNCEGAGTIRLGACDQCRGSGKYGEWHPGPHNNTFQYDCNRCRGKGYQSSTCRVCNGNGRVNEYE